MPKLGKVASFPWWMVFKFAFKIFHEEFDVQKFFFLRYKRIALYKQKTGIVVPHHMLCY